MPDQYDLIIIGAGPGGYTSALRAAGFGMKVAVIERERLGGACLNKGCIPTKALLHAASVYTTLKNCQCFGVFAGEVSFQFSKMQEYKAETVEAYRNEIRELFVRNQVDFIRGTAKLHSNNMIEVASVSGVSYYRGTHVIIATGAKPVKPEIEGIDLPGVMTSDQLLNAASWDFDHMTILGGGVIGVEFATIFNALGAKVTLIERNDRLLGPVDHEVSACLEEELKSRGIQVLCNTCLDEITHNRESLVCHVSEDGIWSQFLADRIVTAVGRMPELKGLLADDAQVALKNGRIQIDSEFRTTQQGVYAIGDVVSQTQLAHVASAQGTYVVEKIAGQVHGVQLTVVPNGMFVVLPVVPNCIYTDPEIATVGITEETANKYNMKVKSGKAFMNSNGKSIISKNESGFIRLLFEAYSNTLVGAQMMCPRATDMIGEMATAIANGLTAFQLSLAMRAHPTYSESIAAAIEDAMK